MSVDWQKLSPYKKVIPYLLARPGWINEYWLQMAIEQAKVVEKKKSVWQIKENLIFAGLFTKISTNWTYEYLINPEVFVRCLPTEASRVIEIQKSDWFRPYWSEYKLYANFVLQFAECLKGKRKTISKDLFFEILKSDEAWVPYLKKVWNSLIIEGSEFRDFIPPESRLSLFDDFQRHFFNEMHSWKEIEPFKDYFLEFFNTRPESPDYLFEDEIRDWFLFAVNFQKTGNGTEILKEVSDEGLYGAALLVLYYLQSKKYEEAGNAALMLHKLNGSRGAFEDPFLNFILGAGLYAGRNVQACFKRCSAFLKSGQRNDSKARALKIFAKMALEEKPDKNWLLPDKVGSWSSSRFFALLTARYFGLVQTLYEADVDFLNYVLSLDGYWSYMAFLLFKDFLEVPKLDLSRFEGKGILPPYEKKEDWEMALDNILRKRKMSGKNIPVADDGTESGKERIIYLADDNFQLTPILQKKRGSGWTKGSAISLTNFAKADLPCMTEKDRMLAAQVTVAPWHANQKLFGGPKAIKEFVDYPFLFEDSHERERLDVVSERMGITVKTKANGSFYFESNVPNDGYPKAGVHAVRNGNRITVIDVTTGQAEILEALDNLPELPAKSAPKLTDLLESLTADVTVRSTLLKDSKNLRKVEGVSSISFKFMPTQQDVFQVEATVKPIQGSPLECQPGRGQANLSTVVKGEGVQVERNLEQEAKNWSDLRNKLEDFDEFELGSYSWELGVEECLEMLQILRSAEDISVIEWPDGVKLKVENAPINFNNLNLSIRRMSHWFQMEGEVSLNGETLLKINELLEKVREARGRFIRLGENEYVQLTDKLKKRLEALDRMAAKSSKDSLKVSLFNAPLVDELEDEGVHLTADSDFKELMGRIQNASKLNPKVPDNLACDLREYQVEGYEWLSRLADWGAGACLADDMGLGKTVQAIALMLARASKGPSLVVVPTAVLYNWCEELTKFAPSLRQVVFNKEDRHEVMEKLKPGDVVLVSYGVLTNEIDLLDKQNWNVAILDEAHTIKNRTTKMSQAVMRLTADFRLLLTGTPLQNHLAEIWNLFEFAVPGLLGSLNQFTDRFIMPIEKYKDKEAQKVLKKILSPFILRRTKSEVLQELPGKTEITLKVSLSDEEKALYETLREEMLVGLDSGNTTAIQALAGLTKLRLAACSPELVDSKIKLPSSKTGAFVALAKELISNHHRALVFSQFTSHLALIKEALDKEGIKYLYLDGSDTASARLKLVEEFQTGEAPLFLISLKAGGTGLNLTAADFVIHLDPWWNPAIEDQASDRTYRIGQQRPVTIYRLIAQGTIEEKILEMHRTKKNLADALLEGTDIARHLGKEEILQLLQAR